jgi:hypothetical protein
MGPGLSNGMAEKGGFIHGVSWACPKWVMFLSKRWSSTFCALVHAFTCLGSWDLKLGYSTGVGWFEYMVESLVYVVAFLGIDKAFENCFFVVIAGEGSSSLLMEEDGAVVGCFGDDLALVSSGCSELGLGFGKGVNFIYLVSLS